MILLDQIALNEGAIVLGLTASTALPLLALWGVLAHPRINEEALASIFPPDEHNDGEGRPLPGVGSHGSQGNKSHGTGICRDRCEHDPSRRFRRASGDQENHFPRHRPGVSQAWPFADAEDWKDGIGRTIYKWAGNGPDMISLFSVAGYKDFDYAHLPLDGKPLFGMLMGRVVEENVSALRRAVSRYDMALARAWASHQVADMVSDAPDGYSNTKRTLRFLPADNPWVKAANHGLAELGVDIVMFYKYGVDYEKDNAAPVYWNPLLMEEASLLWILEIDRHAKPIESSKAYEMGVAWSKVIAALRWVISRLPEGTRDSIVTFYSDFESPTYSFGNQYEKAVKAVSEFLAMPEVPEVPAVQAQGLPADESGYASHEHSSLIDNLCCEFAWDLAREIEKRRGWRKVPWYSLEWSPFNIGTQGADLKERPRWLNRLLMPPFLYRLMRWPWIRRLPSGSRSLPRILPEPGSRALSDVIDRWKAPTSTPGRRIFGWLLERMLTSPGATWEETAKDAETELLKEFSSGTQL